MIMGGLAARDSYMDNAQIAVNCVASTRAIDSKHYLVITESIEPEYSVRNRILALQYCVCM